MSFLKLGAACAMSKTRERQQNPGCLKFATCIPDCNAHPFKSQDPTDTFSFFNLTSKGVAVDLRQDGLQKQPDVSRYLGSPWKAQSRGTAMTPTLLSFMMHKWTPLKMQPLCLKIIILNTFRTSSQCDTVGNKNIEVIYRKDSKKYYLHKSSHI